MLAPMLKLIYHSMSFVGVYFTIKMLYEYFSKKANDRKAKEWFHKVVFFPDHGICSSGFKQSSLPPPTPFSPSQDSGLFKDIPVTPNLRINMEKSTSFIYLLKFIRGAKKTLDLCLLIFTLQELQEALIEAKKRGIGIRVIIDRTMSDCDGSSLPALQKEDIPVLRGPSDMMVHHKFALADGTEDVGAMVATGSLNWTWGGITSNFENLIVSNNPDIVDPFKDEFERLWVLFSN